jgi:hypothetical protein
MIARENHMYSGENKASPRNRADKHVWKKKNNKNSEKET